MESSKAITCSMVWKLPPDGEYDGVWGGYTVRFTAAGNEWKCANGGRNTHDRSAM